MYDPAMPLIPIDSLEDPRVAPFRDLRDKELARVGDRFIAEGEHLVRRLLASDFPCEAVLTSNRRLDRIAASIPDSVPTYVVEEPLLNRIVGYKFHTGTLAIGRRKPSLSVDQLMASIADRPGATLVVCPQVLNTHNLGSIVRVCAALGVAGLVLGPLCCDPFFRKSVRISMGSAFTLPIVRSEDLRADLLRLRDGHGVDLVATLLDPAAEPLPTAGRGTNPLAILLGSEDVGLDAETVSLCGRRVMIPMHYGTDSLNVAIAGAVIAYHFTALSAPGGAGD
jgi:tRNA G18 (ribose-2'-O)-methylase SpoU